MADITRYEVILVNAREGAKYLVSYTPRKSRRGLIDTFTNRNDAIIAVAGAQDWYVETVKGVPHIEGGDWAVEFSGETEHTMRTLGERPYIG